MGVFERIIDGKLSACKVTFGAEPKECEIWEFVLHHYYELSFSPAVEMELRQTPDNPKRRQRNAGKLMVSTKSQEALQKQLEELKTERRQISREEREAEEQRRFALKQEKRREKQKGH